MGLQIKDYPAKINWITSDISPHKINTAGIQMGLEEFSALTSFLLSESAGNIFSIVMAEMWFCSHARK